MAFVVWPLLMVVSMLYILYYISAVAHHWSIGDSIRRASTKAELELVVHDLHDVNSTVEGDDTAGSSSEHSHKLAGSAKVRKLGFCFRTQMGKSNKDSEIKKLCVARIPIPWIAGDKTLDTSQSALIPYLLNGGQSRAFDSDTVMALSQWKWERYGCASEFTSGPFLV
jgi:hypothetical protein